MGLGDDNFSFALEGFEDLWPLFEDNSAFAPNHTDDDNNNNNNQIIIPCREFEFSPCPNNETFRISGDGSQEIITSIDHHKDSDFSSLNPSQQDMFQKSTRRSTTFLEQQNYSTFDSNYQGNSRDKNKNKNNTFEYSKIIECSEKTTHVGEGSSAIILAKKHDHNAKERIRRMKLHTSYISLGSLLPKSRTSKKMRWNAPMIIDKALDYIPGVEKEIRELGVKKKKLISLLEKRPKTRIISNKDDINYHVNEWEHRENKCVTVSANEVKKGSEVILQICRKRDEDDRFGVFVDLMTRLHGQGIRVLSASTLHVGDDTECYNIHIQINGSSSLSSGDDYITVLKDMVIFWLG